MKILVWLRNDLRMDDNPALREACKLSEEVHSIYIYSKNQNKKHNEANCKVDFFIENLKDLTKSLSKVNIPLTVINSDGFNDNPEIIKQYIELNSIDKIFWNNQFGEDEIKRDESVKDLIQNSNNIEVKTFDEQVVFEPGSILTGEGKPYSVFTPFKRKWIENFTLDMLDIEFKYTEKQSTKIKSNVKFCFDILFKVSNAGPIIIFIFFSKPAESIFFSAMAAASSSISHAINSPSSGSPLAIEIAE